MAKSAKDRGSSSDCPFLLLNIALAVDLSALVTDLSALVVDLSTLVTDLSALVTDLTALVTDLSALVEPVDNLVLSPLASRGRLERQLGTGLMICAVRDGQQCEAFCYSSNWVGQWY